jgi:hypothetical protein
MVVVHFLLKRLPGVDGVVDGWDPNPKDIINKAHIEVYGMSVCITTVVFVGGEANSRNGGGGQGAHGHTVDLVPVGINEGEIVIVKDDRQGIGDCLAG